MSENNEIAIVTVETIQDKIYIVRGQQVMLDFELAEIYGYTTGAFNQQVKRNIDRFDEDFRFQLTWDEVDELAKSQNVILNRAGRGEDAGNRTNAIMESSLTGLYHDMVEGLLNNPELQLK